AKIDAGGNIISLEGYAPTALSSEGSIVSINQIKENAGLPIFSYALPADTVAEYSKPRILTTGGLSLADIAVNCVNETYSSEIPTFSDLPLAEGTYSTCVRLKHAVTGAEIYVRTPPVSVKSTLQKQAGSSECRNPDLSMIVAGVEVTLCDGSRG